jgi:hypothetical protein
MKDVLEVTGFSPEIVTPQDGKNAFIRCEIVELGTDGPKRTGKYIHLQLTASDAVRLGLLQTAQQKHQWSPSPVEPTVISIPRAKDRH